jgi:hypothetical protein
MIGGSEFAEGGSARTISKDSLKDKGEWGASGDLKVDNELLAAELWPEMLDLTQKDGIERGAVVSWDGKKLSTSKIITGSKGSFSPPFLPHGLRSLLPSTRDIVYVHTHHMSQEIDHVTTTIVSDEDINTFANLSGKAMVMIDRGGIHMLTRKPSILKPTGENKLTIVEEALRKAKAGGNTSMDVIREVAKSLESHGINYHFSPLPATPAEGPVTLKNAARM